MELCLNKEGFLTNWLISGPKLADFKAEKSFDDQLAYEKYMRSILHDGAEFTPPVDIALGKQSGLKMPWRYCGGANHYVDVSVFYSLPVRVELYAACDITAPRAMQLKADLWTYAALDLWVNGEHCCLIDSPVYKPITRRQLVLRLNPGKNRVFVRMQTLGVRDTRSVFGLQFHECADELRVSMPGGGEADKLAALDCWLSDIMLEGEVLTLPAKPPVDITVNPIDYFMPRGAAATEAKLPENTRKLSVSGSAGGERIQREIEVMLNARPVLYSDNDTEKARRRQLENIAAKFEPEERYCIFNVLARYALGTSSERDYEPIRKSLDRIIARIDCSDFIAVGVIRLMKNYKLGDFVLAEIREAFLQYRFWMDEKGADGMCFWSENHALLFHGTQMVIGNTYPDDIFERSGRTGREQAEIGERRVREWLEDVLENGFEEYNSSGYMCVTLGALLNIVDFGPGDLSEKASRVIDKMLDIFCKHTFDGSVIGPQGRVYRDVIFPFEQGTQTIIHYANPQAPYGENHWITCMATTKYKLPENLRERMTQPASLTHSTGNALIALEKTSSYILTSAQSPRPDRERPVWRGISFDPGANQDSCQYVKSLNERFHGTTKFEPGVFGYQQHMWYAALSNECVVFSNHPGGTIDASPMRPGYWYGNGVFPAVKQNGNILGVIYDIPQDYPIHFTHLYFPAVKFDEYKLQNGWLFARKGVAWLGVWCSSPLQWHNDMLFQSELRAVADQSAYVCICSDKTEDGSFEAFISRCEDMPVSFDAGQMLLCCGEALTVKYSTHRNNTQYV